MERTPVCYIFGAGERTELLRPPSEGDFVIAADGGYDYATEIGIGVDIAIGDFDSIQTPLPDSVAKITLPQEKDDTDTRAALKEGLNRGFKTFNIYGALGGRTDHTLANIQSIAELAQRGASATLLGKETAITAIAGGNDNHATVIASKAKQSIRRQQTPENPAVIASEAKQSTKPPHKSGNNIISFIGTNSGAPLQGTVSVFSHTDTSEGVSETGLKYTLENATLRNTFPIGVSNELIGEPATISVRKGTLIVTYPIDAHPVHCSGS